MKRSLADLFTSVPFQVLNRQEAGSSQLAECLELVHDALEGFNIQSKIISDAEAGLLAEHFHAQAYAEGMAQPAAQRVSDLLQLRQEGALYSFESHVHEGFAN